VAENSQRTVRRGRDPEGLAARFRRFADRECRPASLLYETLARAIAGDRDLLALAALAGPGQPPPNMLLAAVHGLLLQGDSEHPLAAFYPSLAPQPAPPGDVGAAFRDFCLGRAGDIERI
jgi:hypothetical protein